MSPSPLRNMPSVNELLESPRLRKLVDRISPGAVVSGVRAVLEEVGSEVQTAATELTLPSISELAERIARRVLDTEASHLQPVINATGALLASELGSPPLADEAVAAVTAVARGYANVDLDLASGRPADRGQAVQSLLQEVTGAEAGLVVNTKAGATVLAVAAAAAGREVLVARGQLIAAAPTCRLADLVAAAGGVLREVGATNLTGPDDYTRAIGPESGALLLVRPGSYAVVGLSESVSLEKLVEIGRHRDLSVLHDIGLGGLVTLEGARPADEPTAAATIQAGADLALLDGDGLLGGPACGIALGSRSLVLAMAEHPLAAALGVDELTLTALEATLRLWREPEKARRAIPLWRLLGTSLENLQNRAERLAPQLAASAAVARAEAVPGTSYLAGLPIPAHEISTRCVAVEPAGMTAQRLAAALRSSIPPVVGRVHEDRLMVDLRSVIPRQDQELAEVFTSIGSAKG